MRKNAKNDVLLPVGFGIDIDQKDQMNRQYSIACKSIAIDSRDGMVYTPNNDYEVIMFQDMVRFGFMPIEKVSEIVSTFAKMYDLHDITQEILEAERHMIACETDAVSELSREWKDDCGMSEEEFSRYKQGRSEIALTNAENYRTKMNELIASVK